MTTRRASLGFVFVLVMIDMIGFGIVMPVLPRLIMELGEITIDEAAVWAGWLGAGYAAMQFVFAPILGNLSDQRRRDRRSAALNRAVRAFHRTRRAGRLSGRSAGRGGGNSCGDAVGVPLRRDAGPNLSLVAFYATKGELFALLCTGAHS